MRIVNLPTFLALKGEVLFSKYQQICFSDLAIKVDNCGEIDFVTQEITGAIESEGSNDYFDILLKAETTGESIPLDLDCAGRDGMFEEDQLFAIWEAQDVDKLIARLQVVRESMKE